MSLTPKVTQQEEHHDNNEECGASSKQSHGLIARESTLRFINAAMLFEKKAPGVKEPKAVRMKVFQGLGRSVVARKGNWNCQNYVEQTGKSIGRWKFEPNRC